MTLSNRGCQLFDRSAKGEATPTNYCPASNRELGSIHAALTRGDIDAAGLWPPLRFNTKTALKDNAVELRSNPPYKARALVVVREDYAKTHQKEILPKLSFELDQTMSRYIRSGKGNT